jgi:hypothetical protein
MFKQKCAEMTRLPIPVTNKVNRIVAERASCPYADVSDQGNTGILKCKQNISVCLINHQ